MFGVHYNLHPLQYVCSLHVPLSIAFTDIKTLFIIFGTEDGIVETY